MKKLLVIIAVWLSSGAFAQVSFSAGGSSLLAFGTEAGPWGGVHLGVEVPRDDAISLYGRITHNFAKKGDSVQTIAMAIDFMTSPYTLPVNGVTSSTYSIVEGGTRYYLGNGFDFGWAGYGGTNFMLVFNRVRTSYDDFDQTLYQLEGGSNDRDGSIISFGIGLHGGVKYSVPRIGTFYTDINLGYMFLGQASNINVSAELYSPLIFGINLGYRYDILW